MENNAKSLLDASTDPIANITLTPSGTLIFSDSPGDWRQQLFNLAAKRHESISPVVRFWRSFAELFVVGLCRLPDDLGPEHITAPPEAQLEQICFAAPPMPGGEYLSAQSLMTVWKHLLNWAEPLAQGSIIKFLADSAPQWQRVGRVTFHLAENRADSERPFAFMATYVTSLTADGLDRHLPLGQALQQYAGEGNRAALLNLLNPVRNAAVKLKWVADLFESRTIYRPMAFSIAKAHQFLVDVPVLTECGLTVRIPDWWRKRPQVKVAVTIGQNKTPTMGLSSVLDWDVGLSVGEETLTESQMQEIEKILESGGDNLICFKGRWLEVNPEKLKEALNHWRAAKADSGGSGLNFINAMRLLAGLPNKESEQSKLPEPGPWVDTLAGKNLAEVLKKLRQPDSAAPPQELNAVLRPYQKEGLSWLALLTGLGLGACLADDMGLGKTMQVLALLLIEKKRRPELGPSLLVTPASLLANWQAEAQKFAPTLRLKIYHPSETSKEQISKWELQPATLAEQCDLVVTSYGLVAKNLSFFQQFSWPIVVIDEAQAIKNPGTAQSRAIKKLSPMARIALTGTPIENRLTDMWSLFDFLNPGLLGSINRFQRAVGALETGEGDHYAPLRRLISPYLLRRLKTDKRIISDLPDKVETTVFCNLTAAQAELYASVVANLTQALEELPDTPDSIQRKGLVLQSILRLKQVINHPAQFTGDGDWDPKKSGKFLRLEALCQEMAERQQRLLVFTQYREIIQPLFDHLSSIFGTAGLLLHGGTPVKERKKLVAAFQNDDGPPFFILSLKAGGTGLNLTAAQQVIHFDRWWNPAVEDQATDRAFRIGQKKNVLVHKCVTKGTLEERMDKMLRNKRELASDVLTKDKELDIVNLDNKALLKIVGLDLERAVF
ncbi:MAG: DEAD/DEAH box helicase [Deltaproteobacteria bacterium]|nr:DEAD/DEAH box helicase [Deltaproteobacteria bacterium]